MLNYFIVEMLKYIVHQQIKQDKTFLTAVPMW